MKKILTSIFAIAMVAVMMLFVACDSSSSSPYSGSYKEVDAQTLYNSTRGVDTEFKSEPTAEEKVGISMKLKSLSKIDIPATSSMSANKSDVLLSIDGKMVHYLDEEGNIKVLANITYISKNDLFYTISGSETIKIFSHTTVKLYADGEFFYIHTINEENYSGITNKVEEKSRISEYEFNRYISDYLGQYGPESMPEMPSEENEFISNVESICNEKGLRISMDSSSNDIKIKIDVKDKDKYMSGESSSTEDDLKLNKMEMYFIFDENGYMTATKMVEDMSSSTISVTMDLDMRAYNGNISLPSDLDTYEQRPY